MDAERQLELFKAAREHFNEGYSLFREALSIGPMRLNRDESLTMWEANVKMADDSLVALETFLQHDLARLMEPGQRSLTRKQIWRLFFLKRDTGAQTYEALEEWQEMEQERVSYNQISWEERQRQERIQKEQHAAMLDQYYERVKPIYDAFGLHVPRWQQCTAMTKLSYQCSNYAHRFQDEPFCGVHLKEGDHMQRQQQWEEYFGITVGGFDSGVKLYIVPLAGALLALGRQVSGG